MNYLTMQPIDIFSPLVQIIIICLLFIASVIVQYRVFQKTGKFSHNYPVNTFLFFAPIYEEIIFRGILLGAFMSWYGNVWAIVLSSVLFGLWHIRSVFFMSKTKTLQQVLYTGAILGPLFALATIMTGSIWLAVILHFLNNLLAPVLKDRLDIKI